MELLKGLWSLLMSLIQKIFAPILGAFNRAMSVRRVDDGSMP